MFPKKVLFFEAGQADVFDAQNTLTGAMRFRFNKQVGYGCPKFHYLHSPFNIRIDNAFDLDTGTGPLFLEQVRLPGTRILFRRYYNERFQLIILSLKDITFLLFNKLQQQFDPAPLCFINRLVEKNEDKDNSPLTGYRFAGDEFIIMLPESQKGAVGHPTSFLINLIAQEHAIHPLNSFVSQDADWLDRIDARWAQIGLIDYDGGVDKIVLKEKNETMSIILYEWFVLFSCPPDPLCQSIKNNYPIKRNEAVSFWKKATGLNTYSPQAVWNLFVPSLMHRRFLQIIAANPEKALILYFDSLKSGLFWHKLLFDKIVPVFRQNDPDLIALLQLLGLFQGMLGLDDDKTRLSLSPHYHHQPWSYHGRDTRIMVQKKGLYFQALKINLDIQIDKHVRLSLDRGKKTVTLIPAPMDNASINLHFCTIVIDGLQISVPMVWRKFTLKIGAVRLRFLLKKDRFQVTVRGRKDHSKIKVADEYISFGTQQYHRVYLAAPKGIRDAALIFYDKNGCEISDLSPGGYQVKALVTDSRGILQEAVQIKQVGSKKSKRVGLFPMDIFPEIALKEGTEIYGGRRKVFEVRGSGHLSATQALMQLDVDTAPYRINCFIDNLKYNELVQQTWIARFGFSLPIDEIKNISRSMALFNILILKQQPDWPVIDEGVYCKFLKAPYKNVQKCIYFSLDQFQDWIQNFFIKERP